MVWEHNKSPPPLCVSKCVESASFLANLQTKQTADCSFVADNNRENIFGFWKQIIYFTQAGRGLITSCDEQTYTLDWVWISSMCQWRWKYLGLKRRTFPFVFTCAKSRFAVNIKTSTRRIDRHQSPANNTQSNMKVSVRVCVYDNYCSIQWSANRSPLSLWPLWLSLRVPLRRVSTLHTSPLIRSTRTTTNT